VPLPSESEAGRFIEVKESDTVDVRAYRYDEKDRTTHHIFFSDHTEHWSCGAWSSDARLLYCRIEEGRLAQMAIVGGSFAKWQETLLVRHREKVDRFEWIHLQGGLRMSCSRPATLDYAIDNSCELLDPVC
jgi:hypothetical protein